MRLLLLGLLAVLCLAGVVTGCGEGTTDSGAVGGASADSGGIEVPDVSSGDGANAVSAVERRGADRDSR